MDWCDNLNVVLGGTTLVGNLTGLDLLSKIFDRVNVPKQFWDFLFTLYTDMLNSRVDVVLYISGRVDPSHGLNSPRMIRCLGPCVEKLVHTLIAIC